MRRAVFVVLLTLITCQVSGVAALCDEAACDDGCPTDASGGQCPPNCHDCSCCSIPQVTGATLAALAAPPARHVSWIRPIDRLPSPEPADILHVPRLILA